MSMGWNVKKNEFSIKIELNIHVTLHDKNAYRHFKKIYKKFIVDTIQSTPHCK